MMEERNCYKIKFHVVVRKIKSRKRNPSSAKRSRFYVKHENELFRLRCNNFSHKFISKYFTQLSVLISENLVYCSLQHFQEASNVVNYTTLPGGFLDSTIFVNYANMLMHNMAKLPNQFVMLQLMIINSLNSCSLIKKTFHTALASLFA